MKNKIKFLLLGIIIAVGTLLPVNVAFADENGAGFTMEAEVPENQVDGSSYFDLHIKPDTKQDLSIKLTNLEDKEMKLKVSPNPAVTNGNGVIEYANYDAPKDSSAVYTIPELFSKPQDVTLKAHETKVITFTLKVPKKSFEGMILGGFYALRTSDGTANSSSSLHLNNRYALVVGINLREDIETKPTPKLVLNDIKPGLNNGYTVVYANLQNVIPQAFGEMSVDAKVYKKGSKEVFKETKKENQEMAPNSNYDYAIDWENEPIEAGDYHLSLVAKSGKQEWKFEQDFTIADQAAADINKEAVGLPEKSYLWLYILIAVLLLLILVVLAFILGRRKRKDDEENIEK